MMISPKGIPYYIDKTLKENLDYHNEKAIKNNKLDLVLLIDGREGSGKSTLGGQIGCYLDPELSLEQYAFNSSQFVSILDSVSDGRVVIYDEAYGGLASGKTNSRISMEIVQKLTEIRRKHLYIIIILPTFFDLNRYAAIWRSQCLLHCYMKDLDQGYAEFYGHDEKKELYIYNRKVYKYHNPNGNFLFKFSSHFPFDYSVYDNYKMIGTQQSIGETDRMRKVVISLLKNMKKYNMTKQDIATMCNIHPNTVTNISKSIPNNNSQFTM